jgi:hypothetical protein
MASDRSYRPFGSPTDEDLSPASKKKLEQYHADQLEKAKAQRNSWEAILVKKAEALRFRRDEQRRAELEKAKVDAVKKVGILEQQVSELQARVSQLEGRTLLSLPLLPPPSSRSYTICGIRY